MQPTSVSIFVVHQAQNRKIKFANTRIDVEPVFLSLDFKDIALLYFLYTKNKFEMSQNFG